LFFISQKLARIDSDDEDIVEF
jgi:hypothetical protein